MKRVTVALCIIVTIILWTIVGCAFDKFRLSVDKGTLQVPSSVPVPPINP